MSEPLEDEALEATFWQLGKAGAADRFYEQEAQKDERARRVVAEIAQWASIRGYTVETMLRLIKAKGV